MEIKEYDFNKDSVSFIDLEKKGSNWPVVYLIHNEKEIYVGESTNASSRVRQHLDNETRKSLKKVKIVFNDYFNKSAVLDIESRLIRYISAEARYQLQNLNAGQARHNYYQKDTIYQKIFEELWVKLKKTGLVLKDFKQIENTDLFKYSPYTSLTEEQMDIADSIILKIKEIKNSSQKVIFVVRGGAGTGKTILASYLLKSLREDFELKNYKTLFVVAMSALRSTLKKVFHSIKVLKGSVVGPSGVVGASADIVIVDEAHRLRRRMNLTNMKSFDDTNKILGLGNEGDELDWILKSSQFVVLFYDPSQSVRPSDIPKKKFDDIFNNKDFTTFEFELKTQMRVLGGAEYINFVKNIFDDSRQTIYKKESYDFKIFDDCNEMYQEIKKKNQEFSLCRMSAGYSWKWKTKGEKVVGSGLYDIEIGDFKLPWNSVLENWIHSPNAINEVGCIHTMQGYDLNYAGVIIGNEIKYDPIQKKIYIDKSQYHDFNGYRGIKSDAELKEYIINIYKFCSQEESWELMCMFVMKG